mmetsp:Transcript_18627/g.18720  ORF Transcript_18627/g.18720 Transcript_18627/m.18720 type:complete len:337 (-) Transcript_18627:98-1108(-)
MKCVIVVSAILCFALTYGFKSSFRTYVGNQRRFDLSMSLQDKMLVKGGSVAALVTPMNADNSIDYDKLTAILNWHAEEGTDGVVVLGTTGESTMINMEDRTKIIQTSVKAVKGTLPIIIGAGSVQASHVIEYSKQALELGADASLVITPYYVKPPQRALVQHFNYIADTVPLPMIVYNCPGRTGVDMKPDTVGLLASHPNIIGIKDATGDISRVELLRKACGDDFALFSGDDETGMEFVKLGGDGVISVTTNVAPAAMHRMLLAVKEGRFQEAADINEQLELLHKRLFYEANPIPVKKAMEIMGKIGPGIRPPLTSLAPEFIPGLQEALKKGKIVF